jgi:flavin-dependent dehydrogenase
MPKQAPVPDVLVMGEHPAAYFCAALLRQKGALEVLHATLPHEHPPDRLVTINPEFFTLHKLLEPLRKRLKLTSVFGLQFLGDEANLVSEPHRDKSASAYVTTYRDVRAALEKVAGAEGVRCVKPKTVEVLHADETGVDVQLGNERVHCKAVAFAGESIGEPSRRVLGLPDGWPADVVRRYTFLRLRGPKWAGLPARPTMPMSLDLRGQLTWAWLIPGDGEVQLAVERPASGANGADGLALLRHWATVLNRHGLLKSPDVPVDDAETIDLPLAGALHREGVANRTLLIGPAGGFYSACAEDIYPNCWSALFAADVIKKALKEPYLQDALQPYRQKWGATLGDYLRGPQQNLRFLMTLIYRNKQMTSRIAEAILLGKSVIR